LLHAVLDAETVELGLDVGECASGAAAAGRRVDDQAGLHDATSREWRSSATLTGVGSAAACA